jgi:hypothetical protein
MHRSLWRKITTSELLFLIWYIALRRWYINMTITILGIIHRPVFYLKQDVSCRCLKQKNVNKIYRFVLTSQETNYVSATSYEVMLSIGVWRWYVNVNVTILYINHRPILYFKKQETKNDNLQNCGRCIRFLTFTTRAVFVQVFSKIFGVVCWSESAVFSHKSLSLPLNEDIVWGDAKQKGRFVRSEKFGAPVAITRFL